MFLYGFLGDIRRKIDNHLEEQERNMMLLRQVLLQYLQNIRSLPVIQYNNEKICYSDINVFNLCSKNMNDANNKKRENIIGSIIYNTSSLENF